MDQLSKDAFRAVASEHWALRHPVMTPASHFFTPKRPAHTKLPNQISIKRSLVQIGITRGFILWRRLSLTPGTYPSLWTCS